MTRAPWLTHPGTAILMVVLAACSTGTPAPVVDRTSSSSPSARPPAGAAAARPAGANATPATSAQAAPGAASKPANGAAAVAPPKPAAAQSPAPAEVQVLVSPLQSAEAIESRPLEVAKSTIKSEPKVFKLPYSDENLALVRAAPVPKAAELPAPATAPANTSAAAEAKAPPGADVPNFSWPVKGKIIERFEGKSRGIAIAANEGDPVTAAAAGNVIYAGSGIRGYGHLLIIKHNDDFLSVYAHNSNLLVKQGDAVKAGQKIAEVGRTDTDRAKLHFEIRRQGTSIDPMPLLPAHD